MNIDPPIPRFAIWHKQRVEVLYYLANGNFMCAHANGETRVIHRKQMTFIKGKAKL